MLYDGTIYGLPYDILANLTPKAASLLYDALKGGIPQMANALNAFGQDTFKLADLIGNMDYATAMEALTALGAAGVGLWGSADWLSKWMLDKVGYKPEEPAQIGGEEKVNLDEAGGAFPSQTFGPGGRLQQPTFTTGQQRYFKPNQPDNQPPLPKPPIQLWGDIPQEAKNPWDNFDTAYDFGTPAQQGRQLYQTGRDTTTISQPRDETDDERFERAYRELEDM